MKKTKQIKPPTERRDYHCVIKDSQGNKTLVKYINARNENEACAQAMSWLKHDIAAVFVDDRQIFPWENVPGQRGPKKRSMDKANLHLKLGVDTIRRLRLNLPEGKRGPFVDEVVSKALDKL